MLATVVLASAVTTAGAQTRIDAAAMYLIPGTFAPGGVAATQFVFYSVEAVELSFFSFSVRWDSDQVALLETGPGSMSEWALALSGFGPLTWQQVSATEVAGQWSATAGPGGLTALPVSPLQRIQPLLRFQTTVAQTTPFSVTFEFPGLLYADGVPVDTGSGFYNSTILTPVPEPTAGLLLLLGLATVGGPLWRKRLVRQSPSNA